MCGKTFLFLLALMLCLAGCVTPDFHPVTSIPDGKALIYIYRKPHVGASLSTFDIFVDHTFVATLPNGRYSPYFATPGTNSFGEAYVPGDSLSAIPVPPMNRDNLLSLNVEPGHTYYVQFKIATTWGPRIVLMKDDVGQKEIKSCKRVKPLY